MQYAYETPDEDKRRPFNAYDTFCFGEVEELLKLATVLIYQPYGEIVKEFWHKHPLEAAEVFTSQMTLKSPEEMSKEISSELPPRISQEVTIYNSGNPDIPRNPSMQLGNQKPYYPIRHIIGYGPFHDQFKVARSDEFQYRIYLHSPGSSIRVGDLHFIYGNYPFQEKKMIKFEPEYSDTYFNNFCSNCLFLLVQVLHLLVIGTKCYLGEVIKLTSSYLKGLTAYPFTDEGTSGIYTVNQFPAVEEIIKLATVLVYQSDRQLMKNFIQNFPEVASTFFTIYGNLVSPRELPEDMLSDLKLNIDAETEPENIGERCLITGRNNLRIIQKGTSDEED